MRIEKVVAWLDKNLKVAEFDDVSNNGLQIERRNPEIRKVGFAVDASLKTIERASAEGVDMLVVHHGISWGGGIKRLIGGIYSVVSAAMAADIALYACHLPLDAHEQLGNNWNLARYLGLGKLSKAFNYHGNVIGVTGYNRHGRKIGICSGGAGCFAEEAKRLGCELFVTGEADWGEKIAAENCGITMITAGHYETETFGVCAVAKAMKKALKLQVKELV